MVFILFEWIELNLDHIFSRIRRMPGQNWKNGTEKSFLIVWSFYLWSRHTTHSQAFPKSIRRNCSESNHFSTQKRSTLLIWNAATMNTTKVLMYLNSYRATKTWFWAYHLKSNNWMKANKCVQQFLMMNWRTIWLLILSIILKRLVWS